jgi:hypothetical protein
MKRLPTHFLNLLALLAFVATQAIVPAGFMPSSLSEGSGFTYCPGDIKNRALFGLLSESVNHNQGHHHAHHHPISSSEDAERPHVSTSSDDHCQFSILANWVGSQREQLLASVDFIEIHLGLRLNCLPIAFRFFQPLNRAPPQLP